MSNDAGSFEIGQVCPLCGSPNSCAVAKSSDDNAPCWCREVVISEATIARVPLDLLGKACVCRRCATSENSADGSR